METLTTLYRKQGDQLQFWRAYFQNNYTVSFTWGVVGSSQGSRVRSFDTYEATLSFYQNFITRMRRSFSYQPEPCRYRINLKVDGRLCLSPTTEQFVDYSYPIYSAIENELEHNGNGTVGSMKLEDHILTIPIFVVNSHIALNRIREVLSGFGIGRHRVLFLPFK